MARPSVELIEALRETASRLETGARYRWTHMGSCNCGHLAQTLTRLDAAEIHRRALESAGDWTEQSREHCGATGLRMDEVFAKMLDAGLSTGDLADLETLRNDRVRRWLAPHLGTSVLDHKRRDHVVLYLRCWADMMEDQLERAVDPQQAAKPLAALLHLKEGVPTQG